VQCLLEEYGADGSQNKQKHRHRPLHKAIISFYVPHRICENMMKLVTLLFNSQQKVMHIKSHHMSCAQQTTMAATPKNKTSTRQKSTG